MKITGWKKHKRKNKLRMQASWEDKLTRTDGRIKGERRYNWAR